MLVTPTQTFIPIYGKVLLGFGKAVGEAPENIYAKHAQDIGHAGSHLYIGLLQGSGTLRQLEGSVEAVSIRKGAPGKADGKDLAEVQFLDQGNLSQEETVEVMLVIASQPAV